MSDDRYNPWLDAARRYPLVHIEWHPIAPLHAAWCPSTDVILVDESISKAERRCALAHELAHMDAGDTGTSVCWFESRMESAADKLAARRLVDAHQLAEVVRWAQDGREVAAELDVTPTFLKLRWRWMAPWERALTWRAVSMKEAAA
ncbi:ImmA/IrrE family metallo-endopeptidase [uncultured Jatrophihabitans sp.]|uniref:ImmA/IrrE family metallo-endopeptidase n=1 Tax=uncultured Jatrophihabitans sp. TaxID=1610747 RepID=UPI0035C9AB23